MTADEARRAGQEYPNGMDRRAPAARLDMGGEDGFAREVGQFGEAFTVQERREVPHHRRGIDPGDRKVRPHPLANASAEADGQQRMAAELEEIVIDADPRDAESLREAGAEDLLARR